MQPMVFRGTGWARSASRLAYVATIYFGAFAVLWGLGLAVRGWQGWLLLTAPLLALLALRLWAWQRVSVEIAEGVVRYSGAIPSRDWETSLDQVVQVYFDNAIAGRPLVLVLKDRSERICGELGPRAARALHDSLIELGVSAPRRRQS
jgi:hypothetical protein